MKKINSKRRTVLAGGLILFFLLVPVWVQAETKKIEGTTNVEDAMICSGSPDNNYGDMGNSNLTISTSHQILIRVLNVASELGAGATISACVCSMYCVSEVLGAKATYTHRILKPWVEGDENGVDNDDGDVTWNDWASDEYEWTLSGLDCNNDDGVDNSADNGVCDGPSKRDRKSTSESYNAINSTGWFGWTITAALAQAWYDGTANENGILIKSASSGNSTWRGTEAVSNQPFFVFTYTTGEPPEEKGNPRLHRKKRMGGIDEENTHLARLTHPDRLW